MNQSKQAAKEVDFGRVSRGAPLAASPEIFPIGTALPYCAVLRVEYAGGTEWHSPNPPRE